MQYAPLEANMLTTFTPLSTPEGTVTPNDHVTADLHTLTELIFAVTPEATVIPENGVSVFYLTTHWLFALAPHQNNVCLYYSGDLDLARFSDRLSHVHMGDHCLIIDDLDAINLNVLVELLAVLKVEMQRKLLPIQALH